MPQERNVIVPGACAWPMPRTGAGSYKGLSSFPFAEHLAHLAVFHDDVGDHAALVHLHASDWDHDSGFDAGRCRVWTSLADCFSFLAHLAAAPFFGGRLSFGRLAIRFSLFG